MRHLACAAWLLAAPPGDPVRLTVEAAPSLVDVPRVGVNLGSWHSWGAEQLVANVLQNPGLEGLVDRAVAVVGRGWPGGFTDGTGGSGRGDGFWERAVADVRTGARAGTNARVATSWRSGRDGAPEYALDEDALSLEEGDVVALTRTSTAGAIPRWSSAAAPPAAVVSVADARPGSPGTRSAALRAWGAGDAALLYSLDAIGTRAGRLLPLAGRWHLSFWARTVGGRAALAVRLGRAVPSLEERIVLDENWREVARTFDGRDGGAEAIELRFAAPPGTEIHIDDVSLQRSGETGFRAEVLDVLRRLQPGFLRDWPGQQADPFADRAGSAFARRAGRSGDERASGQFSYGLGEYLELCARLQAMPWIVAPVPYSDGELVALGSLLRTAPAVVRHGAVVEFGNENWNPLSRGSGLIDPAAHAAAAGRALAVVAAAAQPALVRGAVNAPFVDAGRAGRYARVPAAALLAVAPYFAYALEPGLGEDERAARLFPDDGRALVALAAAARSEGKELASYELGLHTTKGAADDAERTSFVAGAAAGAALAARLLDAQQHGIRLQAVYALAGFDSWRDDRGGFVRLWGLARDLGPTLRLRPTGLAVAALNRALPGDRHAVRGTEAAPFLRAAAYRTARGWSAALVSARRAPTDVVIVFPDGPAPERSLVLDAPSPWATNEDAEAVRLVERPLAPGRELRVTVPALGLVVLLPRGA
ncbi:MAG: hypothetical protein ABW221_11685 [Vicinamibacteria bacterium]